MAFKSMYTYMFAVVLPMIACIKANDPNPDYSERINITNEFLYKNRAFQNLMALNQALQNRLYKQRGLQAEMRYEIGAAQSRVTAESGERNESVCDLYCRERVFGNEMEISLKDSDRSRYSQLVRSVI